MTCDLAGRRVWIAGHAGMVGSALVRRLGREDCILLTAGRHELDLARQDAVEQWMEVNRPEVVVVAAARVGGIHANDSYPADFLYQNLMIESNIIQAAWRSGTEKLLFLGSSCIYPRDAAQPVAEDSLLTGPLEPTNEWYAVAKIAGVKLCQAYRRQHGCDFIAAMPTNLFGPGDNFHPENSHVPAALLDRFHRAKAENRDMVPVWGSGRPRREFLHVDDMADAGVFLLKHYSDEAVINVGTGRDIAIAEFARLVADVVGFRGRIVFDPSRPDGAPQKRLDTSRLQALGWTAGTGLRDGLEAYYRWYLDNLESLRT